MFDPSDKPRVFGLAPGVDFPKALVDGLQHRFQGHPPEAIARTTLIVNTTRMQRRIRALFDAGPASFVPRIRLLTDVAGLAPTPDIPPAAPKLARRFELVNLVKQLLDADESVGARAALYDLSDSLAALMDEMQGEGVPPSVLSALDVTDESGHWKRAQAFIALVERYFDTTAEAPDKEARQRRIAEHLAARWAQSPTPHPVILAGSTGSRGTTMLLMEAVAKLPQGAIVLPGFDFDMPDDGWTDLAEALRSEDHPQFRFRRIMDNLGLSRTDVTEWHDTPAPSPARNAVLSLALRPAPVTDRWLSEGPKLTDIPNAFENVTLLNAPTQREEALAIALRLRKAAEDGQTAALITPDRMLSRQVTAALDRWDIEPDDSAGTPLQLTAAGRFLRHVSRLFHQKTTVSTLLELLKHPLTHTGSDRNEHLRRARELELWLRNKGHPYPDADILNAWAIDKPELQDWATWVAQCFTNQDLPDATLSDRIERHIALAERIAAGPETEGTGKLWEEKPGREARKIVQDIRVHAPLVDDISASDYADLFGAILSTGQVRDPDKPHPNVLIWGTLEARVQGAELIILGGLNEGSWPEMPAPDPWLNRRMRDKAGLLLPERRIGLSAHDFQQAVAAPEVWMTRALKSDDAQTVPSRWLNRMQNLLNGLPEQGGQQTLKVMTNRGDTWLAQVTALEEPGTTQPAKRPSPRPPVDVRPNELPVTSIRHLIRDPYAIYARRILGLNPLNPLDRAPDALLRGIVIHDVFEAFIDQVNADPSTLTKDVLVSLTKAKLAELVPWPSVRAIWLARVERVADWFIATEIARRKRGTPVLSERKGKAVLETLNFTLTARADRIDQSNTGALRIYDYKTGTPPSKDAQKHFDKQLLLESAIAEIAGFGDLPPAPVAEATYIGLGTKPVEQPAPLDEVPVTQIWGEFQQLIQAYTNPDQGYTARRALQKDTDASDYDHLSRFGEWDVTDDPDPEVLT